MSNVSRRTGVRLTRVRALGMVSGAAVALLFMACVPIFTGGLFQTLNLSFSFDDTIAEGTETVVYTSVFPESVKIKKNFVQISGRLTSGGTLPDSITVKAEFADLTSGKVSQKLSIRLQPDGDGIFSASSKVKKNIAAGEMMTVALEPSGSDLAKNTDLTLCVDWVKKKGDLNSLPACVTGAGDDDGGGGGGGETFSALQNDFFTATCARIGCHSAGSSSGGLVLEAGQAFGNLVNVPSQQSPSLNRVTPNDPDNSYIVRKLRGDAGITGDRMPQGGPFLSDAQIERFVSWINSGAPNN